MSDANRLPNLLRQSETKLILLVFTAPWSGGAELLLMALKQIKQSHDIFAVVEINQEDSRGLAVQMGIMQVPTTLLLRNHEIVDRFFGPLSRKQLLAKINAFS